MPAQGKKRLNAAVLGSFFAPDRLQAGFASNLTAGFSRPLCRARVGHAIMTIEATGETNHALG
jgi:hypothetical protein